jgi:RNase P protein component
MQQQLPDWDFVVMAKPLAVATDAARLRQSLDQHFERLKRKAVVGRDG